MLRDNPDLQQAHAIFPTLSNASHWMGSVRTRLSIWLRRSRTRHALSNLDDHLLRDIGLNRTDQIHEAGKPFWR